MTAKVATALLPELAAAGTFHLYVVDNDSRDGSFERLTEAAVTEGWGDRVTVVAAPHNGGYGAGINVAVNRACAGTDKPDYIYVLNSDAIADPGIGRAAGRVPRCPPRGGDGRLQHPRP